MPKAHLVRVTPAVNAPFAAVGPVEFSIVDEARKYKIIRVELDAEALMRELCGLGANSLPCTIELYAPAGRMIATKDGRQYSGLIGE